MTDRTDMRIRGQDRAFAKLRRSRPFITEELLKAVTKNALEHQELSQTLVRKRSMELHDSIEVEILPNTLNPAARVYAGPPDFPMRAKWEEFGTGPHRVGGRFAGAYHPGTSPNPFFFGPYRLNRKRATSRIARGLSKGIKRGVR